MAEATDHMDVAYVATLARIRLEEGERALFQTQLDQIVGYMQKLSRLDLGGIEPTLHAYPVENVMRADVVVPGLAHAEVMRNAPAARDGQFLMPRIVE